MKITNFVKSLLERHDKDSVYWIRLGDIILPEYLKGSRIKENKYKKKWRFYRENGYCESDIILDKNFVLKDGYSSYKIYKISTGIDGKVPVRFV